MKPLGENGLAPVKGGPLAGVARRQANLRGRARGHQGSCAPTLGVGVESQNAAPGTRPSPSPSRSDGKLRGMAGLNLPSGKAANLHPSAQDVKVGSAVIAVLPSLKSVASARWPSP